MRSAAQLVEIDRLQSQLEDRVSGWVLHKAFASRHLPMVAHVSLEKEPHPCAIGRPIRAATHSRRIREEFGDRCDLGTEMLEACVDFSLAFVALASQGVAQVTQAVAG